MLLDPSIYLVESNLLRAAVEGGGLPPIRARVDDIERRALLWSVDHWDPSFPWNVDYQYAAPTNRMVESIQAPIDLDSTEYHLIEIGRIGVPSGSIGYLKTIEQVIQDSRSGFFPTASEFWGVPYQLDADLDLCHWYFRLSPFDGTLPARIQISQAAIFDQRASLPGRPFDVLADWSGVWYPPHCGQNKLPNIVVPGGYCLRWFVSVSPTAIWSWQVGGRMRAQIQSATSKAAVSNTSLVNW